MKRRPLLIPLAVILALSFALLLGHVDRALAQTETPLTPTFAPSPTLTATPEGPLVNLKFNPIDLSGENPRLSVEIALRQDAQWPAFLRVVVTHPDSMSIALAELDGESVPPEADSQAAESIFIIDPPAQENQAARQLALTLLVGARTIGDQTPFRVRLTGPAAEPLDDQVLLPAEMDRLFENAAPSEPTRPPQQAQPEEPVATEAPVIVKDTPVPPSATAAPATVTATPVSDSLQGVGDVGQILLIFLVGALGLLFLAVVAYILYRVLKRPQAPASEPIAMRPQPETPAGTPSPVEASPAPLPAAAAAVVGAETQITAATQLPAQPFLTLVEDPDRRFDITGDRFTIGRGDGNKLQIGAEMTAADTVSRFHATIYRQNDQYVIEDMNSHNGVWVNGQAVPKIALQDGARIGIGGVEFIYHSGNARTQSGGTAP